VTREDFIYENLAYTRFGDEIFWGNVFDSIFDEDRNGKIDFNELIIGLSFFHHSNNVEDKLTWIFNAIDENKDGYLSKDEVTRIVQFITKLNKRTNLPPLVLNAEELFGILDKDKDGKVTLMEFQTTLSHNSLLAKNLDFSYVLKSSLENVALNSPSPVMQRKQEE